LVGLALWLGAAKAGKAKPAVSKRRQAAVEIFEAMPVKVSQSDKLNRDSRIQRRIQNLTTRVTISN